MRGTKVSACDRLVNSPELFDLHMLFFFPTYALRVQIKNKNN
uniref:Uncharacterized protein n=1 Tax=Arundo donax TaxID=35708 RepID=A0A0A9DWM9_ARUDO